MHIVIDISFRSCWIKAWMPYYEQSAITVSSSYLKSPKRLTKRETIE